jgi:hypothetical protein
LTPIVYKEKLWLSLGALIPLSILIVVISVILSAQEVGGIKLGNGPAPIALLAGLDLIFIVLLVNFLVLKIEVTSRELKVSYGVLRETIRVGDIASATPLRAGFWLYGGMGIRMGSDSSVAYTTSMGGAVRIVRREGHPFVFSSKRPEYLSSVIRALTEDRPIPQ